MDGLPLEGEAAVVDAVATQTTKGTLMVKRNDRPRLTVTADGRSVVGHAGARLLSDLADDTGLTQGLSEAMAPIKKRRRGHDRGQVVVDLAVMVADDGESISDLATLRDQPELFGHSRRA